MAKGWIIWIVLSLLWVPPFDFPFNDWVSIGYILVKVKPFIILHETYILLIVPLDYVYFDK